MTALPQVDVVLSYINADGVKIEAAAKAGAKGIWRKPIDIGCSKAKI